MIAVALTPSLLAFAIYAARGAEARDAYLFANYVSIFMKTSHGATARLGGLGFFLLYIFPSPRRPSPARSSATRPAIEAPWPCSSMAG